MNSPEDFDGPDAIGAAAAAIYRARFPQEFLERRQRTWKILCSCWLARYIPANARVLELGAGYCEFINNIEAAERVAVDVNPDTKRFAAAGVKVITTQVRRLAEALDARPFDVVFMSNFLEHMRTSDEVLAVLRQSMAALNGGGRLIIMGPNFRYCCRTYYDFFDHHLALTDKSAAEAVRYSGFEIERVIARTLPFSFSGRLPSWPWIVRLYLLMPWIWPLFGKQFFIVARKPAAPAAVGGR
jgi:hypothetical protein